MNTNFENYKTFYFVAKYGNITAAADALYSEQPNVTRAIKNLERDLGCVLFTRSNKGVTLTPEGEKLYRRVAIAYEQIAAAEEELSRYNGFEEGILRIGVSETALHEVLLAALVKYHALYPKIKFNLINFTNVQAIGAVKNQAVDFVLIATPFDLDKSLKSVPIKRFQDIVVCGERYKYLSNEKVSLDELTRHCIVSLNKSSKTYEYYRTIFRKHGLEFAPDIEVSTSNQILPIVQNNLGIGFIPSSFAEKELASGDVFKLETSEAIAPREVCLIKRSDFSLSVAAKAFEKLLKE
ncbi:MAG: LysR family transcriptional regulator [Firmicutes bacterium]|nr:LysR family transcriptional regulator [Bacillota bacterium]MDY5531070.1 LysR family transcriptional regulator [Pumilibacteraceae bacterium]